jgi:hypothetical protein
MCLMVHPVQAHAGLSVPVLVVFRIKAFEITPGIYALAL